MYEDLRELAGMLAGHVPSVVVDEFLEFLDAGEPDVGLEWLCDDLFELELPLTQVEIDMIRATGEGMGLTRSSVLDIGELLAEE